MDLTLETKGVYHTLLTNFLAKTFSSVLLQLALGRIADFLHFWKLFSHLRQKRSLYQALDHPYYQKQKRQMAAIDSRPRRPLSNAHTPSEPPLPPIQTPPKPPGTVPPAVRAITTHPLQFHNGRTGWPQAMQIFAANREDWRQRLENGKSVEKIYIPYIHLKIAHLRWVFNCSLMVLMDYAWKSQVLQLLFCL